MSQVVFEKSAECELIYREDTAVGNCRMKVGIIAQLSTGF
jgi:hypothetical protein